jgi:hypothetical protein
VLLVVPDLREILSGTKRATLRLLSGAGRCGVRVVGKRVQEQFREAVPGQVLTQLHPRRKDQPGRVDSLGQLRTGSFMDYAMPKAGQLPPFLTAQLAHPSMINDLGIKGVGESGAISPGAVISNAVEDALADFRITIQELPLTPARIFTLLKAAGAYK